MNKQVPWPEQSFNDEQFGGSQSPFEFLAFPSSHLVLHSPVFKLPVVLFYLFSLLSSTKRKRKKKKKKKKKKKEERNHQSWLKKWNQN